MQVVPTLIEDTANILLLVSTPKEQQILTKALSATGCKLHVVNSIQEAEHILSQSTIDLLVADYDQQSQSYGSNNQQIFDNFLERFSHLPASAWVSGKARILLLASRRKREEMSYIFHLPFATNIVAKTHDLAPEELIITVGKIIRNDIFGIEKYLCYGSTPVSYEVSSSLQKDPILNALSEYAANIGINKRIISAVASVADELLMNAIYNAPVYPNGVRPYARRSRTIPVELTPEETCFFSFASDGTQFVISVRDRFGSLTPEKIRGYLARCFAMGKDQIEQKQGGAGMGFYFIMENLNKLIVNISPGRGTEFIGIIDISGTYKDYIERYKSFHIFVG
ncbi:MAG: hypothetical protein IJM59_07920 [Proteobacteria bacterium]|nr:hypothetical protein [Pseudomonadota bacterium]